MEQTIAITLTRAEFDKLATGWFKAQQITGPCTCDVCTSVTELLADCMEELLALDELIDLIDAE